MNLHDQLDDALVGHPTPDLDRTYREARSSGTRLRRRRRALTGTAATGALAVVVGVGALASSGPAPTGPVATGPVAVDVPVAASFDPADPGPSLPATGPGLAAALRWSVAQVAAGDTSHYSSYRRGGQEPADYVDLRFDDADGLGGAHVELNVQTREVEPILPCGLRTLALARAMADQGTTVSRCSTRVLGDGSQVRSYEIDSSLELRDDADPALVEKRLVVVLTRADGVRVIAQATNGFVAGGAIGSGPGNVITRSGGQRVIAAQPFEDAHAGDDLRPSPPLGFPQLQDIAEQRFWGDTLPRQFVEEGHDLVMDVDS